MAENISGIIDAIAEKAAADADKIVALAEEYAAAKLAAAMEEAEKYLSESAADTAARCAFIRERSESNARIDRKKALAGAKADVVDEVFNAVRQKLENMSVKEAAQLFIALIEKYADDGKPFRSESLRRGNEAEYKHDREHCPCMKIKGWLVRADCEVHP